MAERRYSKSFEGYAREKQGYFDSNEEQLRLVRSQNRFYARQPRRVNCKLCDARLPSLADLVQHAAAYAFCDNCGHLNGMHEDTEEFVRALYTADGGEAYAADYYMNTDFRGRAEAIYAPKVEFLTESVGKSSLLDVGCGAGHLVYAALARGIAATGVDVSREAVGYGNAQISALAGYTPLLVVREEDVFEAVSQSSMVRPPVDVVSAVGLIEHLREPSRFFQAFRDGEAEYLFFSVPMVSLSVYLENAMPGVWPRQLSGAHTHLFTEESLAHLYRQEGLEPVAEWRFGTDAMDLYRGLWVSLRQSYASEKSVQRLEASLAELLGPLQEVLDRAHFCSEIHVVAKRA